MSIGSFPMNGTYPRISKGIACRFPSSDISIAKYLSSISPLPQSKRTASYSVNSEGLREFPTCISIVSPMLEHAISRSLFMDKGFARAMRPKLANSDRPIW